MSDLSFDTTALTAYLQRLHKAAVQGLSLMPIGQHAEQNSNTHKAFGYGKPVRLTYRVNNVLRQSVLHTTAPGPFGHEHMADRAAGWLWSHRAFNTLPGHVRSYDVGAICQDRSLVSLGSAQEFFLLTDYAEGHPYADDMSQLGPLNQPGEQDLRRCDALCDYLLRVHAEPGNNPSLYARRIRELVGHHECIFGLIDSYAPDDPIATPDRLQAIEQAAVRWRWKIKAKSSRLRRVHGDFHPWNLIFDDHDQLSVLDRSRGEYGDPADDVTSLTMNYLFQALLSNARFTGACRVLFDRFWRRYLTQSGDAELLAVAPPFIAFRGLVLASPLWFPNTPDATRHRLLRLIERTLDAETFDPGRIDERLDPKP